MNKYRELAQYLTEAEKGHYAVSCITDKVPEFDIQMGYGVQNELVNLKREQGHEVIALKMGLTSLAKMKQMRINEPIYGYVFDYMKVPDKGYIEMDKLIHPKVEAEIAFILGDDIEGPGITCEQVLAKTKWILPALEVIDSRFQDFNFKLPDVIADNTSSSRIILGNQVFNPNDFEIDLIGVTLSVNGEIRANGVSTSVLGHPANSVAMLANMLWSNGKGKIPKGTIILTGGITEAILLNKGDYVTSKYDGLGDVSFHVR